jgi:hypothetical protein
MGLFPGSTRSLPNATPIDVAVVDVNGDQLAGFDGSRPANATLSQVTYAAGSQVLLPANPARRQFKVVNTSGKPVNLAYGATASLTAFTDTIPNGSSFSSELNGYTGVVSVIWQAAPPAGAKLQVTEITT